MVLTHPLTRFAGLIVAVGLSLALTGCPERKEDGPPTPPPATEFSEEDRHRQHGRWLSAIFGGGGYVQNVVISESDPQRFYAYVDVGGIYRSDDGGETWRMIHGGLPSGDGYYCVRGLLVDPEKADHLVAAVGNQWTKNRGIFVSEDGGETWEKTLDAQFLGNEQHRSTGFVLVRGPDGSLLAGSAGDGLWRSSDGGSTWKQEGLAGVNVTDIDFTADGGMLVCAQPHKMPDGRELKGGFSIKSPAAEWEEFPSGPEELVVRADGVLTGIFGSNEVRSSRDGGRTWESDSAGLPVNAEEARGFASESRFRALAAGPDFQILGSGRGTIYRRANGQSEWQKIERLGVVETLGGRPWWGRIKPGKWQHFGAAMGSLTINPRDPAHWWFTDWYGIYESRDAGATWELKIDGVEVTVIHGFAQDPHDPGRVHAGMADNGYVTSADGGRTFDMEEKFLSNMKALAVEPSLPGRIYGTGDGGSGEWRAGHLWVSADGGGSWIKSPMRGVPQQNERAMNSLAVRSGHPYEVAVAVSGTIGSGGGVFRSVDGGLNFEPLNEGLEGELFHQAIWGLVSELAYAPDGTLVAASQQEGTLRYLPPGASRWEKVSQPLSGKNFQLRGGAGGLFQARGDGGVWRSEDGQDWSQISREPAELLTLDAANPDRLAVAAGGTIRLSADGGATWEDLGIPPFGQLSALGFVGQRLVVGTRGGGFFFTAVGSEGEANVQAGPAAPGILPVAEETTARLPEPQGTWTNPWKKSGELVANPSGETWGVKLQSVNGAASGSTGLVFPATGEPFRLSGKWQAQGDETVAKLAARAFDAAGQQIRWQPLAEISADQETHEFHVQADLPAEAARGEIVLLLEGDGSVEITDIAFSRPDPVFGHPVSGGNLPPANAK